MKAEKATYGIPVSYPTPNRSKNLKITVNGKQFDARLHDSYFHLFHGLIFLLFKVYPAFKAGNQARII